MMVHFHIIALGTSSEDAEKNKNDKNEGTSGLCVPGKNKWIQR